MFLRICWCRWWSWSLKRIPDFSKLMVCPVCASNYLRVSESCSASVIVALQKMKMSSAKSRWLMIGPFLEIWELLKRSYCSFWWRSFERTSIAMIKRKGERGSHCLSPLEEKKDPVGDPLSIITNFAEVIQLVIMLIQCSENPRSCRDERIVSQLILSKAFNISSLMAMNGVFLFFVRIEWIISWAIMILSEICRFFTNAPCRGEMNLWRRGLRRFARIF